MIIEDSLSQNFHADSFIYFTFFFTGERERERKRREGNERGREKGGGGGGGRRDERDSKILEKAILRSLMFS